MIKMMGAILLIGGATAIGLSASANLTLRAKALGEFLQILNIMRSEICERLTPLDDILRDLSEHSGEPWKSFFRECFEEMKQKRDIPFRLIWSKQLTRAECFRLKPQEKDAISALGNVLGRYSADEQRTAIEQTLRRVDSMATSAERDRAKLGKLYAKLGLICGVSIVIVFI